MTIKATQRRQTEIAASSRDDVWDEETLIADIKSGDSDKVSKGIRALERRYKGLLISVFNYGKRNLARLDQDDLSSNFQLAIYNAAVRYQAGDNFFLNLRSEFLTLLRSEFANERQYEKLTQGGTFTDVETRMDPGGDAKFDSRDLHAPRPEAVAIAAEDAAEAAQKPEKEDICPIFGAKFPPRDHIIYHYGGLLNRVDMVLMDLAEGLSSGRPMPAQEISTLLDMTVGAIEYHLDKVKETLRPYASYLQENSVPHPYRLELADPLYLVLERYANTHNIRFKVQDYSKWFELVYPVLPEPLRRKCDQFRGVDNEYSLPKSPRELLDIWRVEKTRNSYNQVCSATAKSIFRLIKIAQRNLDIDDNDYPYWLIKPSEIKACFARLDSGEWTIPNALNYLLPKMGHRPYRDDLGRRTPKSRSTTDSATELISLDARPRQKTKPVERKLAIDILTSVLSVKPTEGFAKSMRECPEFFERLMERLSGAKIRVLRRAKELQDLGELTYETLGNVYRRWCGGVSYPALVKFAHDHDLNVQPVHSALDKPRLVRMIIKQARPFETTGKLTMPVLQRIVTEITKERFSDHSVAKFVDKHGLRLANQPGAAHQVGRSYLTGDTEPEIIRRARLLEEQGHLSVTALNDIVYEVTGHRYANPVSLDPLIRKHRLKVTYDPSEWQLFRSMPKAQDGPRTKTVRVKLSTDHKSDIRVDALKLAPRGLLTVSRLNRIVHDISGMSLLNDKAVEALAKELDLRLVEEPMTIFHDLDRGYEPHRVLREMVEEAGLNYRTAMTAKRPDLPCDKVLPKLCLEDAPQLSMPISGPAAVLHLIQESLKLTTSTPAGRILRTPQGYEQFMSNLKRSAG